MVEEINRCAEVYRRWLEAVASRVPIGIAPSLARIASIAAGITSIGIMQASSEVTLTIPFTQEPVYTIINASLFHH